MAADAREQAVFQELILDHYRRPRNRRAMRDADRTATLRNPLCGDDVAVYLRLDGDPSPRAGHAPSTSAGRAVVREMTFTGQGCSITQAAASMLTVAATGRTLDEVAALVARFRAMIAGDAAAAADERLGELRALAGVARHPGRLRCALLPVEAYARAMAASGPRDVRDAAD